MSLQKSGVFIKGKRDGIVMTALAIGLIVFTVVIYPLLFVIF